MKKLLAIALVCGAFLLAGCSVHSQSMLSANLSQTQVVLTQNNFKVVGQVEGTAQVTRILGIGGCSNNAVRNLAANEMVKNANLTGAQTIINVNYKRVDAGVNPFYVKTHWIATGTVIEFTK